ncbi:MAG TPA: class I SAM-dependent methyltransferase [Chloroflexota bacterium]|nr:class I SAM-dependent methyltransferase [Chloroflexota bacterium]
MKGHRWFAAMYDVINRRAEARLIGPLRRHLLTDVTGRVLEIGAGTGASFPYFRAGAWVAATEPDPFMLRRARGRAAEAGTRVVLVQCVAEALPFRDSTFDEALSALVLCTVGDPARSVVETRRVLRPGGKLRFIEHVRGEGVVGNVQDAISPVWRRVGAGCHPNRRSGEQIAQAGFAFEERKEQPLIGGVPLISGVAVAQEAS